MSIAFQIELHSYIIYFRFNWGIFLQGCPRFDLTEAIIVVIRKLIQVLLCRWLVTNTLGIEVACI